MCVHQPTPCGVWDPPDSTKTEEETVIQNNNITKEVSKVVALFLLFESQTDFLSLLKDISGVSVFGGHC